MTFAFSNIPWQKHLSFIHIVCENVLFCLAENHSHSALYILCFEVIKTKSFYSSEAIPCNISQLKNFHFTRTLASPIQSGSTFFETSVFPIERKFHFSSHFSHFAISL